MNLRIFWNEEKYQEFILYLYSFQDEKFKQFSQRLIQTEKEILGIKTPFLGKIAKEIAKGDIHSYLEVTKGKYHEELLLEGMVLSSLKEDEVLYPYLERFIDKIDNWAICDMVVARLKIVKKNKELYYSRIKKWLKSDQEFRVRVGLIMLLDYYIEEDYIDDIFHLVDQIQRKEYYINMGIAWLLSVCYVKYKSETLFYLDHNHLDKFTYNKTIQKIIESNRVEKAEKVILRQRKKP